MVKSGGKGGNPYHDPHSGKFTTGSGGSGSSLTGAEARAVDHYVAMGYEPINRKLRHAPGECTAEEAKVVAVLDRVIARSTTTVPMTVHRSVDAGVVDHVRVGDTFTDHGFVSTSHSLDNATPNNPGRKTITIALPTGSHALHIPDDQAGGEEEVLLPRGSAFVVTAVAGDRIHMSPVSLRKKGR